MDLMLQAAGEERSAMNLMLTDPDVLADYVNEFFGPEGPYPTETDEETETRMAQEYRDNMEEELEDYEHNYAVPANFQRPQMEMPTPGEMGQAANDFWGGFTELMDRSPESRQYLQQAPNGALQTKMLVQDL